MPALEIKQFRLGANITLFIAVALLTCSIIVGKQACFLLFNGNWGNMADLFFSYATYLGDGWIWVPVALLVMAFRRNYFPLLLVTILVSTLLTQSSKRIFFTDAQRPMSVIENKNEIHTVKTVEIHSNNSFPSGHTTTAFCVFLLACLLIKSKTIVLIGLLYASIAGYSRIYLAQHFPLDVAGGMLSAIVTVYFALYIQSIIDKKKQHR